MAHYYTEVRFPLFRRRNFALDAEHEPLEVLILHATTWDFIRMDGEIQRAQGWRCPKCSTTFFVSCPLTQLEHECMRNSCPY